LLLDDAPYIAVYQNDVGLVDGHRSGSLEEVLPASEVIQCHMPRVQGADNIQACLHKTVHNFKE